MIPALKGSAQYRTRGVCELLLCLQEKRLQDYVKRQTVVGNLVCRVLIALVPWLV